MPGPHESPESSSPIITRAVAAGLAGKRIDNYQFPGWQRIMLRTLGAFPQDVARIAISSFQALSGLNPNSLETFALDELINARIADYDSLTGRFPAIVIGAGLGGATTYLSLALHAPFLPQAFVITLAKGSLSGDADEYLARSLRAARAIAGSDPRLMTIQHFDPVHDGWLTRYVNHLRFKLVDLPEAYKEFINNKIEPGGTVVFLEGGATWPRYRLGPRSVFQVGGWGDITSEEFLNGSRRLSEYARKNGLKHDRYRLKTNSYPLESGPESEWGSESGLAESLENYCHEQGLTFTRVTLPHPNDFSRLAFAAAKRMLEKDGAEAAGTMIECFSQFDSSAALAGGLLPLWLIFNTSDSARYLKEMAPTFPKEKPVFFSPLATFSLTPDMATWQEWQDALGRDFINFGTRQSHYPADAAALLKWSQPLWRWVEQHPQPIRSRLQPSELVELADRVIWDK